MRASTLITITRTGLNIFGGGAKGPVEFAATEAALNCLTIIDAKKLHEELSAFVDKEKLKLGSALVVLDEDLVYVKDMSKAKPEDFGTIEQNFLQKVPVAPTALVRQVIEQKNKRQLLVTDQDYYGKIISELEKLGCKISGVVPAQALTATPTKTNYEKIQSEAKAFLDAGNHFVVPLVEKKVASQKKQPSRLWVIVSAAFAALSVAAAVLIILRGLR